MYWWAIEALVTLCGVQSLCAVVRRLWMLWGGSLCEGLSAEVFVQECAGQGA